jgi:hypothetical protein
MSLRRVVYILAVAAAAAGAACMSGPPPDIASFLPDDTGAWSPGEADKRYNPDNLFDYINGGAELYLSYGFTEVLSRRYASRGRPDIVVDVFDMGSSQNAYGVFSHSREIVDSEFGQGSQYSHGLMLFWKDRYYVSILASPETDETREAVFDLARSIDGAIPDEGPLPGVLSLLPESSLDRSSVRYFHHHVWLNSHYFVADENILLIEKDTNAVLAKYSRQGDPQILLVVEYPDAERASTAAASFVTHYAPELEGETAVQIEDGTWVGRRVDGPLLSVVFNAPSAEDAVGMLDEVDRKAAEGP